MTIDEKPRLCGGTFFVLVLQALKQRAKVRQHYSGERDGLSDPEVLVGLIKVINPEYQAPKEGTLKGKANDFKSCKTSTGQYLPFGNTPEIETFDERVMDRFQDALNAMCEFVNTFLEMGTEVQKDVRLVKALIELIQQDDSIEGDEEFYVCEDGGKIKKTALSGLKKVCLPAFLLGVWHYVVVQRKDNTVGQATYDAWCPKNGGAVRVYSGSMGRKLTAEIDVYTLEGVKKAENSFNDINKEYSSGAGAGEKEEKQTCDFDDENTEKTPTPTIQNIYSPLIIQQSGANSTVIPNYGTISLNLGKRGDKKDE